MTSFTQTARIAYKAGIDTAARVAMLVVTVAAARALSREAFGVLALALATGWLLGVASDLGLPIYLARAAAARERGLLAQTLASVVRLRLVLGAIAVAAAGLAAWWWTPSNWRLAFGLIVLSQVVVATIETIGHLFRGLDRSEIEAHLFLGERLTTTIAALVVLTLAPDLTRLAVVMVVPPLITLPVAWLTARTIARSSTTALEHLPASSAPGGIALARAAAPLGLGILVSALYFRIDVFFVEYWHGLAAVGAYSAVFRIVGAVRLLPSAVLAVLFPSLCRADDVTTVARVGGWLLMAGVAIASAIGLAAAPIVTTIYGASFADAVPALRVLALSVPLFFLNYALTHQVIGWDRQRAYLAIVCLALAANVAANAALVPSYGAAGAAAATGLTELVVTAGCVWALASQRRAGVTATRVAARGVS